MHGNQGLFPKMDHDTIFQVSLFRRSSAHILYSRVHVAGHRIHHEYLPHVNAKSLQIVRINNGDIMAEKKAARGMLQLKKELEDGVIKQLYLLYGSERYLIREYKERLLSKLVSAGDTLNFTVFSGSVPDIPSLLDLARTMPFLSERRVILIEDSGFFLKASDDLIDGLSEIAETTVLIFIEPDVEKSTGITKAVDKRGRLYKLLDKAEGAYSFDTPDDKTLLTWIKSRLASAGRTPEGSVPERLLDAAGRDMMGLENEMEKLISYTMGKDHVTVKDVEAICISEVEEKVFEMIDALSSHDRARALRLYSDLLYLKEAPMKIIALIRRQYLILLKLKHMQKDGTPKSSQAKLAGIPPYYLKNYEKQAAGYSYDNLLKCCDACFDASLRIQQGTLSDQDSLEQLILLLLKDEKNRRE